MLEVRLDLPKQVCSVWPQQVPSVSPLGSWGSRSGSSEERGSPVGDRSHSVCRCCGASDLHDPAGVSHPTCGGACPTPTSATGASPCSFSRSLLPDVFTFPRVWLSLCPPLPSVTDNLEVNQRTFAKDRLVLTPSCEDGWLGGWQAPGLEPALDGASAAPGMPIACKDRTLPKELFSSFSLGKNDNKKKTPHKPL